MAFQHDKGVDHSPHYFLQKDFGASCEFLQKFRILLAQADGNFPTSQRHSIQYRKGPPPTVDFFQVSRNQLISFLKIQKTFFCKYCSAQTTQGVFLKEACEDSSHSKGL